MAQQALRTVLKHGLPARDSVVGDVLLDMPGVTARASGSNRASRVAAFNALLPQLLARMEDRRLAAAAATLFGDVRAAAGKTMTARRAAAARSLDRDPDHFRKHIEPRLLEIVAAALAADSERMVAPRATPPRLIPVIAQPQPLPEDMFAWEAVEHDEHMSRLWAAVFALRAELLACARLASMDPAGPEVTDCADAALWRAGQLHIVIRRYRRAYGSRLLHGNISPDVLLGLAGWSPNLSAADVDTVCHLQPDSQPLSTFVDRLAAIHGGQGVRHRWVSELVRPPEAHAAANRSSA